MLLFAIAIPYAGFLNVPEATWAYMLIALVPILKGVTHFDIFRLQRQMTYRPFIATEMIPALLSLLSVWPLVQIFGDWRAMLYAILLQQALMLAISHVMAARAYRLSWDWPLMKRALEFGWPLLVNGALLFGVFNGEKLIVGRELGMADLGLFAMAFSLTLTPTLVLAKSAQSFFLPQLSRVQEEDGAFNPLAYATLQTSLVIGLILVAGVTLFGPPFVAVALGEKYAPMLQILIWLGIAQALRVLKTGIAVVSLARAKTRNAMIANAVRVAALPLAWWLVVNGGGMTTVIAVAIAAETLGFFVALWLVNWQVRLPLGPMIAPAALTLATFAAIAWVTWERPPALGLFTHLHLWHLVWLTLGAAALATMTPLRRYARRRATA